MRRSWLFVPGDAADKLAKAASRGADVLIIDLEDAVPAERKAMARAALAQSVAAAGGSGGHVAVRINPAWRDAWRDLDAAVGSGVGTIVVPKVETPGRLETISAMLGELEAERGLPQGNIRLNALIESPAGLAALDAIAASERVDVLSLGTEDFSLVLGAPPTPESLDLPCRLLALAASARGVEALALPISIAVLDDDEAFSAAAAKARAIGLTGALCIHPRQVQIVNQAFSLGDGARAQALAMIEAWERMDGDRLGVISWRGMMIDRPVILHARQSLG